MIINATQPNLRTLVNRLLFNGRGVGVGGGGIRGSVKGGRGGEVGVGGLGVGEGLGIRQCERWVDRRGGEVGV